MTPQLGISIVPAADSLNRSRELARVADEGGIDLVGVQDHPYQRRFLDAFALIATLLARNRADLVLHRRSESAAATARGHGQGGLVGWTY